MRYRTIFLEIIYLRKLKAYFDTDMKNTKVIKDRSDGILSCSNFSLCQSHVVFEKLLTMILSDGRDHQIQTLLIIIIENEDYT